MPSTGVWRLCYWVIVVCVLYGRMVECGNFQGERYFGDYCEGCVVSNGLGFNTFPGICSCFVICELGMSAKLPNQASPWISHKRCCPCGQTFSKKLLTCVDYTDKRSDCFNAALLNNVCVGKAGLRVPRPNPNDASPSSIMCSGFLDCVTVGTTPVPNPSCCPTGECYNPQDGTCNQGNCDVGYCATLRADQKDDCTCQMAPLPIGECDFVTDDTDDRKFMGRENMHSYTCAAGTCWDQSVCSCVAANNTGYNECLQKAKLDFETDFHARDGRGNFIWTRKNGNVEVTGGVAEFDGGQINVAGLANSYLSNDFVLHFQFMLTEDDTSSVDETQCLVGDCLDLASTPTSTNKIGISIDRTTDSSGTAINLRLTYTDSKFMSTPGSVKTYNYAIPGTYALDTLYDFWLIYCGSDDKFSAGVVDAGDNVIGSIQDEIPNSVMLVPNTSGFLFGSCVEGEDYEGVLDNIEMWTICKPYENADFNTANTLLAGAPTPPPGMGPPPPPPPSSSDSVMLVPNTSGFLFGSCVEGEDYEGVLDNCCLCVCKASIEDMCMFQCKTGPYFNYSQSILKRPLLGKACMAIKPGGSLIQEIEMWTICKPYENADFNTANTLLAGAPSPPPGVGPQPPPPSSSGG